MKKDRSRAGYFWIILAAIIIWTGCDSGDWNSEKIQPPAAGSRVKVNVEVVTVRDGNIYAPIRATGTILPQRESKIGTKLSGRIEAITVDEGDAVKVDRIVVELEKRDFELAYKNTVAQREMARASIKEAKLHLKNITREKDRIESLYRQKVVSQQKYDDTTTAYSMAVVKLDVLNAQLKAAEANLELAAQRLKDSTIRSPLSGYIVEKYFNEGEFISPGMPVLWIMDIDRVKVEIRVPEVELTRVKIGIPVDVELDALPDRRFEGAISAVNARVDPVSRNFTAEIDIPNTDQLISAGMFARITIKTNTIENVIIVPQKAIVADERGRDAVFVLADDGRAILRFVTTGAVGLGMVEIRRGLAAGEQVLVSGNYGLTDNSEVNARSVEY